jgi:hypothetical protein
MGGPDVWIKCCTPVLAAGRDFSALRTSGKRRSSSSIDVGVGRDVDVGEEPGEGGEEPGEGGEEPGGGGEEPGEGGEEPGEGGEEPGTATAAEITVPPGKSGITEETGNLDPLLLNCLVEGSTVRWKNARKSTPMMGNATSASRKGQEKRRPEKLTVRSWVPQQRIGCPAGPERGGPEGGEDERWGMIEKAAPVSTRNCRLSSSLVRYIRLPGATAHTRPWQASFPARSSLPCSGWPCRRMSSDNNTGRRSPAPGRPA